MITSFPVDFSLPGTSVQRQQTDLTRSFYLWPLPSHFESVPSLHANRVTSAFPCSFSCSSCAWRDQTQTNKQKLNVKPLQHFSVVVFFSCQTPTQEITTGQVSNTGLCKSSAVFANIFHRIPLQNGIHVSTLGFPLHVNIQYQILKLIVKCIKSPDKQLTISGFDLKNLI